MLGLFVSPRMIYLDLRSTLSGSKTNYNFKKEIGQSIQVD
nr:MAG TPA: hypothetical protein [Caudoviricetes sp.]